MAETAVYAKSEELASVMWEMTEVGKPEKMVVLPTTKIPLQVFESMFNRKSLYFKHRTGSKMYLFRMKPLENQIDYLQFTEEELKSVMFDEKFSEDAETRRKCNHLHEALDLLHGVRKRLTSVGGYHESKRADNAADELAAAIRASILHEREQSRRFDGYRRVINRIREELAVMKFSSIVGTQ